MKKVLVIIVSIVLLFSSCHSGTGRTLTSATGSIYECLVVIPSAALTADERALLHGQSLYNNGSAYDEPIATIYDLVRSTMSADMPCLPQMEPYFTLTCVTPEAFDDFLKPTRNILIVDIDATKYTSVRAKFSTDYWSHPQAVYRIQSPDQSAFVNYWLSHGAEIREWFVRRELERHAAFYRASTNKSARAALQSSLGCDMLIEEDYMLIMDTTNFIWCCNNKGSMRRDLVIYAYPYTDMRQLSPDSLMHKRDEMMARYVHASTEGSYMGTEYNVFPPQTRSVPALQPTNEFFAYETRGLWKIFHGESMGGPFVSLTRVDTIHRQIITAETFLYASGQKKRNALRQAEAILYTLQFVQSNQ
ncbi:MAG: DUF4837 family protein [Bacteroidales bacterium]|nr:DUF4837 family protein [Candidatus Colicola coprequi]